MHMHGCQCVECAPMPGYPVADSRDSDIQRLNAWRKTVITAADAILAPMTAKFGRIMEEAPDQKIELTLCSHTVRIEASKFMALYRATDT